jgi:hypothetical protein
MTCNQRWGQNKIKLNTSGHIFFKTGKKKIEPANVIEKEPRKKWKKNEWKIFHEDSQKAIIWMRKPKILELAGVAEQEGFTAIYPSGDDNLDWKERPCA